MATATASLIPLSAAYLCVDCSCIGDDSRQCWACTSEVVMSLAGVLNRETDDNEEEDRTACGTTRKTLC